MGHDEQICVLSILNKSVVGALYGSRMGQSEYRATGTSRTILRSCSADQLPGSAMLKKQFLAAVGGAAAGADCEYALFLSHLEPRRSAT